MSTSVRRTMEVVLLQPRAKTYPVVWNVPVYLDTPAMDLTVQVRYRYQSKFEVSAMDLYCNKHWKLRSLLAECNSINSHLSLKLLTAYDWSQGISMPKYVDVRVKINFGLFYIRMYFAKLCFRFWDVHPSPHRGNATLFRRTRKKKCPWPSISINRGATTSERLTGTTVWFPTPGRLCPAPGLGRAGCWMRKRIAPSRCEGPGVSPPEIFWKLRC